MKRFDKGYIYANILSDLFVSLALTLFFLKDLFIDETAQTEDVLTALPYLAIGFAVIYLFLIAYHVLYYKNSGYEVTDTQIRCNRGVFFKKRSVLEHTKVHAINKRQNILYRIFGIAVLTIDSGSTNTAHQAEITIVEKTATVDRLMNALNRLKEGDTPCETVPAEQEVLLSDTDTLYRFTSKRKMLYTFFNIISTAFGTVLLGVAALLVIGICRLALQQNLLGTWGEFLLITVLMTVGFTLVASFFSFVGCIVSSFVGYYKFTITRQNNDIQIAYGLLEQHTNTFSYDRIKAVKISQDLMKRILGFATIKLEVIGYTNENGQDKTDLGVLVPFCKYDEVGQILAKVLPDFVPDIKETQSVSYFPFISWFSLIFGVVVGLLLLQTRTFLSVFGAAAPVVRTVSLVMLAAGAVVWIGKALSAALSYRTNGLAINENKITAYYGGFTRHVTVFMSRNLVAVEDVTTPLRKKKGITSLIMHLKTNALSNEITVHIQTDALSKEMESRLTL